MYKDMKEKWLMKSLSKWFHKQVNRKFLNLLKKRFEEGGEEK